VKRSEIPVEGSGYSRDFSSTYEDICVFSDISGKKTCSVLTLMLHFVDFKGKFHAEAEASAAP
jgi:hypothetical protein